MKFCLSILLLVLIGFNTHGQIGPWVQVPTPGTERIQNTLSNKCNLYLNTYSNGLSNPDLFFYSNHRNTTTLNSLACDLPNPLFSMNSIGLNFFGFTSNEESTFLTKYDTNGICLTKTFLYNWSDYFSRSISLNTTLFCYVKDIFFIQRLRFYNSLNRNDSICILQINTITNQVTIKTYPEFGKLGNYTPSLDTDNQLFLRKITNQGWPLFIYNPYTTNFDSLCRDAINYTSPFYWNGTVMGINRNNNKIDKLDQSGAWLPFMAGLDTVRNLQKLYTFEDRPLLQTAGGFYVLNSDNVWVRNSWSPPLPATTKIVKAGNNIYALSSEQLYILFNNEWQPVPMTGVIRGSSGSLYANDQYMFFSNRYLSFNNGQSWFDQQRYFNSTSQNSIGSIQTMRPEAWFSFNSANNWSVHRTTDQGTTWQSVETRFLGNPVSMGSSVARNVRWGNTDTLYAAYGTNFLRLAVSTDAGLTWRDDANLNLQLPAAAANNIGYACTLQVVNNNMLLYTSSGKLFRTGSRSTPFEEVYDFGPQDLSRVFITGSGDTVIVNMNPNNSPAPRKTLISTDGGRRFQEIRVPFPNQFASFALRKGQLWCANNGELSISNDLGRSFQRLYNPTDNFPFPNTAGGVATFNITDSMLFINGNHVAFYTRLPQGRVVSLAAEIQAPKEQLSLYPNPANERVFVKGLTSSFDYQILNSLGQIMQSGNSEGEILINKLPAGTYFLRTTQNNQTLTQRFVKL